MVAERRASAFALLAEVNADAFFVSFLPNVRYLSGFTGSNGLVVLTAGKATLFTDPRYSIQAREESDCEVKVVHGPLHGAALELWKRKKWGRVAFEGRRIDYGTFLELDKDAPGKLVPVQGIVERLRAVKSEDEIERIRTSVQTNSAALERAIRKITPRMTESGLAAELEYQMRRLGAEKPAFETIVAAGARSALPHAQPGHKLLNERGLLLIDMGAMQAGYASDMTRVLHLGKPSPKTLRLYQAVLEAQLAAIAAVQPGKTAGAVDKAARKVLKTHGFEREFVHSTGHGLGLEIHEPPRLGKKDGTVLQPGMVITIEPGAYLEGFGGVRIEDTVVVTAAGCEVLTPTTKDLRVI